jgi:hypothetical protein
VRFSILIAAALLTTQVALADSPQPTPGVELARIAEQIRALEVSPLSDESRKERTVLFQWLTETPDVRLKWCAGVLTDIPEGERDYWAGTFIQMILSAGAFVIENPADASNDLLVARAGLRGALRTYRATLRVHPERDSAYLAALAAQEEAGRLDDYLAPRIADCKEP